MRFILERAVDCMMRGLKIGAVDAMESAIRAAVREGLAMRANGGEKDVEGGKGGGRAPNEVGLAVVALRGARSDHDVMAGLEMECERLREESASLQETLHRERAQAEATIRELRARIDELQGEFDAVAGDLSLVKNSRDGEIQRRIAAEEERDKAIAEASAAMAQRDEAGRQWEAAEHLRAAAEAERARLRQELERERQQRAAEREQISRLVGGWA